MNNIIYMILLIAARPFHEGIVNFFAVLNELFLFIIGCYLFMYLDENISRENQYFFAWVIIFLVVVQMMVNICVMIPYKIAELIVNCKNNKRK